MRLATPQRPGAVRNSEPVRATPPGTIRSRGVVSPDIGEYPVSARERREVTRTRFVASNVVRWEAGLVPRAAFPDFMDGRTVTIVPQQIVTRRLPYRGDLPFALQPIVAKPFPWTQRVVR
jgi:hypothetical protein